MEDTQFSTIRTYHKEERRIATDCVWRNFKCNGIYCVLNLFLECLCAFMRQHASFTIVICYFSVLVLSTFYVKCIESTERADTFNKRK